MAQTIQRDLRQPGGGDVLLEPGGEAGRVDSSAVRPGEQQARVDIAAADKRPLGGLDDQVVVEGSDGRRVERERAAPGAVFGSETTTWWSTSTRGSLALTRAASRSRSTVRRPATSLRLRQRIDQAKADVDLAAKDARQDASAAAGSARSKWAQMKTDAAAKMDDLQDKMDKRADQIDANIAADQAYGAEADAADAIDFAAWTVDNARLAVLDAIDARAYADDLARSAGA